MQLPHCGECAFLDYEDIYGFGWCRIDGTEHYCGHRCSLQFTEREAERILHHYQKWRRGAVRPVEDRQPHPHIVARALDCAVNHCEAPQRLVLNEVREYIRGFRRTIPDPAEYGRAIDHAIRGLREYRRNDNENENSHPDGDCCPLTVD